MLGPGDGATRFSAPIADAARHWLGSERKVGNRLGAWTLLQPLGEGGMGRVFLAARSDGHCGQRAAIRLLLGWSGADGLGRLQRERQILAGLDHPHNARLIDGGTTPGGQPYLVMAYVEGQAIDQHGEGRGLPLAARLELFQRIGDAVSSAHRQLVVHGEIKPSNGLVTPEGRPMLLDFGSTRLDGRGDDLAAAMPPDLPALRGHAAARARPDGGLAPQPPGCSGKRAATATERTNQRDRCGHGRPQRTGTA